MADVSAVDTLAARVAGLEAENARLTAARAARSRLGPGRAVLAAVLIVVALLLAPVAAIGTWARLELVDTDRFVATFAPLAEDPDVQAFVAAQVSTAITEQIDIPSLVSDLVDGIRSLGLPPRAGAALGLLEAPAAQGIQSLIDRTVAQVVASPVFADVWAQALRLTHSRAIALLQGTPGTALVLEDDGTIALQLGPIVDAVRDRLSDSGVGWADLIPSIDRSIDIVQSDALVLVRTVYTLAMTAGFWLSWLVVALLALGILIARRRLRALALAAAGFALTFVLLAGALGVGRLFFVGTVSPSIMPRATAEALFDQLTSLMLSAIVALALLGVLTAVIAWITGASPSARATRGGLDRGFAAIRTAGERRRITTGRFGRWVDRWRVPLLVLVAVLAALLLLALRPPTVALVIWVVVGVLVAFAVIELVRRPATATDEEATDAAADPAHGSAALVAAAATAPGADAATDSEPPAGGEPAG